MPSIRDEFNNIPLTPEQIRLVMEQTFEEYDKFVKEYIEKRKINIKHKI